MQRVDFSASAETPPTICVSPRDSLPPSLRPPLPLLRMVQKNLTLITREDSTVGNAMLDLDDNTHTLDRNLFYSEDFIALRHDRLKNETRPSQFRG